MRKHINNLRQQHPSVRTRVALLTSLSVVALVGIVWLTTLPFRLSSLAQGNAATTSMAAVIGAISNGASRGAPAVQTDEATGLEISNNPYSDESAAPQTAVPQEGEQEFPAADYGNY